MIAPLKLVSPRPINFRCRVILVIRTVVEFSLLTEKETISFSTNAHTRSHLLQFHEPFSGRGKVDFLSVIVSKARLEESARLVILPRQKRQPTADALLSRGGCLCVSSNSSLLELSSRSRLSLAEHWDSIVRVAASFPPLPLLPPPAVDSAERKASRR